MKTTIDEHTEYVQTIGGKLDGQVRVLPKCLDDYIWLDVSTKPAGQELYVRTAGRNKVGMPIFEYRGSRDLAR